MTLKTFDTILTKLCDDFDVLITPKRITRSNTNIIYLMFKAIAKGYEVINNIIVVLSNKFNPESCSDEDLISVSRLVGTEKLKGSYSGLYITISNSGTSAVTLTADTYIYSLDDDTKFYYTLDSSVSISAGGTYSFIALTDKVGVYPVTSQAVLTLDNSLPSGLSASCQDNQSLLGAWEETNVDFRHRILTDMSRQDTIKELEFKIKNLPYVFDCSVKFNNTNSSVSVGSITVPPFHMVILISGIVKPEIAEIVASYGIYPTTQVEATDFVEYESDVFTSGSYKVYYAMFDTYNYGVKVTGTVDSKYTTVTEAKSIITNHLLTTLNSNTRKNIITENEVYKSLSQLSVNSLKILNVELLVNNSVVPYIEVPQDCLAKLSSVTFDGGLNV